MAFTRLPTSPEPTPEEIAALRGPAVLEFGATWCGHCIAAQPLVEAALAGRPEIPHLRVEDGRGRRLGRAYRVKLWPTLVFLRDGLEQARVVRPSGREAITEALAQIDPGPGQR